MKTTSLVFAVVGACLAGTPVALAQNGQSRTANRTTGWPCVAKGRWVDPTYVRTAEATGGHILLTDPSEMGAMATLATGDMTHKDVLVRLTGQLDATADVAIPVDSTVESLFIVVTLQCLEYSRLLGPSGTEVRGDGLQGGEDHPYRAGRIIVVPRPQPGTWTMRLEGKGFYSIAVQAKSTIALGRVRFEHGLPRGGAQTFSVSVLGEARNLEVKVIGPGGEPLGGLTLAPASGSPTDLAGHLLVDPMRSFRVVVLGKDAADLPFQRVDPRLYEASLAGR